MEVDDGGREGSPRRIVTVASHISSERPQNYCDCTMKPHPRVRQVLSSRTQTPGLILLAKASTRPRRSCGTTVKAFYEQEPEQSTASEPRTTQVRAPPRGEVRCGHGSQCRRGSCCPVKPWKKTTLKPRARTALRDSAARRPLQRSCRALQLPLPMRACRG